MKILIIEEHFNQWIKGVHQRQFIKILLNNNFIRN